MLQAALNGSRPEDAHPALPVQARHLARDARAVARLGVTSVHVHPRGPDTLETLEPVHVGDAVAAIRTEVPSMEIGVTTGRWIQPDPRLRIEAVVAWGRLGLAKPDFCSVNVHELGWEEICRAAASVGIGVELGVWTSGDAVTLRKRGIPPMTTRVLAESTVTDPDTAVAESVRILRALGKLSVPVLLHGEEGGAWPVLEYALRTKQDTRIGFEDVLQRPDGWLATGNDDLVRAAQTDPDVSGAGRSRGVPERPHRHGFWRLQRNRRAERGSRRGNPSVRSNTVRRMVQWREIGSRAAARTRDVANLLTTPLAAR